MLQYWFSIVRGPPRFWDKISLNKMMMSCMILNNMITGDERNLYMEFLFDNVDSRVKSSKNLIQVFLETYQQIEDIFFWPASVYRTLLALGENVPLYLQGRALHAETDRASPCM